MNNNENRRSAGIDIIKTLAAFLVVCVHFSLNTRYYETPLQDLNMLAQSYVKWCSIISVPLFIMCTGYLMNKKRTGKTYYPKLLNVLIPYYLICVIYLLFDRFYFGNAIGGFKAVLPILSLETIPYSWYVQMYFALFLLIPFLNLIPEKLDKSKYRLLILSLLIIFSLPVTFNQLLATDETLKKFQLPHWWPSVYPILYYFIGDYIRRFKPKANKLLCAAVLLLVPCAQTALQVYMNGFVFNNYVFGDWGNLFIVIESTAFFLLFYDIDVKNKAICFSAKKISAVTLEIYLFSSITDKVYYKMFYDRFAAAGVEVTQEQFFKKCFVPVVLLSFFTSMAAALIFNFIYVSVKRLLVRKKPADAAD